MHNAIIRVLVQEQIVEQISCSFFLTQMVKILSVSSSSDPSAAAPHKHLGTSDLDASKDDADELLTH